MIIADRHGCLRTIDGNDIVSAKTNQGRSGDATHWLVVIETRHSATFYVDCFSKDNANALIKRIDKEKNKEQIKQEICGTDNLVYRLTTGS